MKTLRIFFVFLNFILVFFLFCISEPPKNIRGDSNSKGEASFTIKKTSKIGKT